MLPAIKPSGSPRRVSTAAAAQPLSQNPAAGDAASANVAALANSQEFQSLSASPQAQRDLLAAANRGAGDGIYTRGLQDLAGRLQGLDAKQQAAAIKAFGQVAGSEAYQGRLGGWFTSGTTVSGADKGRILANTAQVVTSPGFQEAKPDVQNAMLAAAQNHGNAAAQNTLALTNSQAFRGLNPVTQKDVLGVMERHANDQAFRKNLTELISDPGFAALGAQNAQQARNLVNAYGNDSDFAKGVDTLRGSSNYTNLNGAGRSKVLDDVTKLAGTESYASASQDRKPNYKPLLINMVGNMSAKAEANPGNTILRNTVNHIVNGDINIGLFKMGAAGGDKIGGFQDEWGIYKNVNPESEDEQVIYHEANHRLNNDDKTKMPSPERFYAEYRAHNVGLEAVLGRPLTANEQTDILKKLVVEGGYWELKDYYSKNKNPSFTQVVNRLRSTLSNGTVVSPATVAQWLGIPAGNLDNH